LRKSSVMRVAKVKIQHHICTMRKMNTPIRIRMFLAMVGLIVLSFIMTGSISYLFFKAENEEYNLERIKRKEYAIRTTVDYFISNSNEDLYRNPEKLIEVFDDRICELADIHNQDIGFYDFNGKYIISSLPSDFDSKLFPAFLYEDLYRNTRELGEAILRLTSKDGDEYLISASVVVDEKGRSIAILIFPYEIDKRYDENELRDFFSRLFTIFFVVFLAAVGIALFLSNSIAKPLTRLKERIAQTRLDRNLPIKEKYPPEIQKLVNEYNRMLKALQKSATELARKERDAAWRDMARQVAHEIKNPLTPMKLNLQLLARKHPDLDETIKGLVAQVDAMAQIADAFSRYANIPELQIREFDLNEMLRTNMLVHQHEKVNFIDKTSEKVLFTGDPDQLTRAVNNLVKNALQAGHEGNTPNVEVVLEASISEVLIHIVDDGVGIPRDKQESIFEPRFTTKTGGMGLGLSIVRTIIDGHGGKIDLKSTKGKGSEFTVHLPRK